MIGYSETVLQVFITEIKEEIEGKSVSILIEGVIRDCLGFRESGARSIVR